MNKPLVIIGSARKDSDTERGVAELLGDQVADTVHLLDYPLEHYNYDGEYSNDHFETLVQKMIEAEKIILASPVYWYNISGHMKVFMDRWTDLFARDKESYDKLKGKLFFLIACYGGGLPTDFADPVRRTCEYMGFSWGGHAYWHSRNDPEKLKENEQTISAFQTQLSKST